MSLMSFILVSLLYVRLWIRTVRGWPGPRWMFGTRGDPSQVVWYFLFLPSLGYLIQNIAAQYSFRPNQLQYRGKTQTNQVIFLSREIFDVWQNYRREDTNFLEVSPGLTKNVQYLTSTLRWGNIYLGTISTLRCWGGDPGPAGPDLHQPALLQRPGPAQLSELRQVSGIPVWSSGGSQQVGLSAS